MNGVGAVLPVSVPEAGHEGEDLERRAGASAWQVLVVDTDARLADLVRESLLDVYAGGRPIEVRSACDPATGLEAIMAAPDTAVLVVSMSLRSGLDGLTLADQARAVPGAEELRVIVVTEQASTASVRQLIAVNDVDDVIADDALNAARLFSSVFRSLRYYRELTIERDTRHAIERMVDESASLQRGLDVSTLARGWLDQLCAILGIQQAGDDRAEAVMVQLDAQGGAQALAACGRLTRLPPDCVPASVLMAVRTVDPLPGTSAWRRADGEFVARMRCDADIDVAIFARSESAFTEVSGSAISVFCRHVLMSLSAQQLEAAATRSQNRLIMMLGEAIERRSMETGNHVRRVGEYSRLLGRLCGLRRDETELLLIAAALHDAGKVAIPDAILNKPGRLTAEERTVMQTHAAIGARMFEGQDTPVLEAARVIALQHHERWDGRGYPNGLSGQDIHIYGRIAGIADVFDALASDRVYKRAWPMEKVLDLLREERGRQFDPQLVDLMLAHLPKFLQIRAQFVDPPMAA